ncbi:Aste57867_23273 [Aphanomyces stellatus]|uniref:Aste57867_23273 protein n=1 Tax=Aphanomyces stellatus TaxID=120398 RepID=A0A485LNY5_9STRA|nr:hypothetical protein As57867_023202 [Aphanomyces stellatus]VFT99918.1 Aste57867_23273 [Aphanomyces stellatus]
MPWPIMPPSLSLRFLLVSLLVLVASADDTDRSTPSSTCVQVHVCSRNNDTTACQRHDEPCPPCLLPAVTGGFLCVEMVQGACPATATDCRNPTNNTVDTQPTLRDNHAPREGLTTMHVAYIVGVSLCAVGIAVFLFLYMPEAVVDSDVASVPESRRKHLFLESFRGDSCIDFTMLDSTPVMMTMPRQIALMEGDDFFDLDAALKIAKNDMETPFSYTFSSLSVSDSEQSISGCLSWGEGQPHH